MGYQLWEQAGTSKLLVSHKRLSSLHQTHETGSPIELQYPLQISEMVDAALRSKVWQVLLVAKIIVTPYIYFGREFLLRDFAIAT